MASHGFKLAQEFVHPLYLISPSGIPSMLSHVSILNWPLDRLLVERGYEGNLQRRQTAVWPSFWCSRNVEPSGGKKQTRKAQQPKHIKKQHKRVNHQHANTTKNNKAEKKERTAQEPRTQDPYALKVSRLSLRCPSKGKKTMAKPLKSGLGAPHWLKRHP